MKENPMESVHDFEEDNIKIERFIESNADTIVILEIDSLYEVKA